ncbi:MAG: hypothetical protein A2086_17015 [Spirochaetes bacterium GWD1_27_9]|nr:MAG: hypothetical protein A2Z98_15340 [Spirochaetes bacterium GWB1_27_13]OHD27657.1 MAG: hypothetical protein A2Y34_10695 [Spirochaetes bacterium GWC1_27_15]OHD33331.1 MAG: hypothetical protein A2086_17015 [Spirochaetes bacterium GWD1_27_9]
MKKIVFLILTLSLLLSCKTNDVKKIELEYASGIENIKHNLQREKIDLFEAYIEAKKYLSGLNEGTDAFIKCKAYIDEIISQIDKKATDLFKEKKYEDSLKYSLSLKTLNANPSIPLRDVYLEYSKKLDMSSDIFTRNSIKEDMANLGLLKNEEVFNFLKYYKDQKSSGFFFYYFDKYKKLYPSLITEFPQLNNYYDELKAFSNFNIEELMKSVVTVILNKGMNIKDGMGYFDKAIGSGFFIDDDGYILTNHHVIADHVDPKYKGYTAVYVTTRDDPDTEIPAQVIGYDKVFDIALLKIAKKNHKHLVLGRSDDMKVGDKIYTIGNPIGIKYTVTSGIISNKEIDFFQLGRAFQIDAAVNPGNSGGPVIDEKGQVIGIVFAGVPQYQGINFAIPFQWVIKTIPALYKGGEVKRSWIGAGIYNQKDRPEFYYVLPSGEASKAGIKVGDILQKIDGVEVKTVEDAQGELSWRQFPQLIEIEKENNGKKETAIVRLEERPYLPVAEAFEKDSQGKLITLVYGISLEYYDNNILFKKYKVDKVYKRMLGSMVEIGEGDPIIVYDLKYIEKDKMILFTVRFKKKDVGFLDRIITIPAYVEINTIL